jgi:hypothetical protein
VLCFRGLLCCLQASVEQTVEQDSMHRRLDLCVVVWAVVRDVMSCSGVPVLTTGWCMRVLLYHRL